MEIWERLPPCQYRCFVLLCSTFLTWWRNRLKKGPDLNLTPPLPIYFLICSYFINSIFHDFLISYDKDLANHLTLNFDWFDVYKLLHGSLGTDVNRITLVSSFETLKRTVNKNCLTNACIVNYSAKNINVTVLIETLVRNHFFHLRTLLMLTQTMGQL